MADNGSLSPSSTLVERVKEREKSKQDLALVYNEIFRKRSLTFTCYSWAGHVTVI